MTNTKKKVGLNSLLKNDDKTNSVIEEDFESKKFSISKIFGLDSNNITESIVKDNNSPNNILFGLTKKK